MSASFPIIILSLPVVKLLAAGLPIATLVVPVETANKAPIP